MSINRIQDSVFTSISIDKKKKLGTMDRDTDSLTAVDDNFFFAFNGRDNHSKRDQDPTKRGKNVKTLEEQWREAQEMVNLARYRDEFLGTHIDSRG